MFRPLLACSLALATGAFLPAAAHEGRQKSDLDDGRSFGTEWSGTGAFSAVTLAGSDSVQVTAGDRWQIRASGDPRALAQLRFLNEKGTLVVGRTSREDERYGQARIEIVAPRVERALTAGSGALVLDRLSGDTPDAVLAGSGRLEVRAVEAERLKATVAGSGTLALAGRSDRGEVTIAGSGSLDGRALALGSANVSVAGSGTGRFRSSGTVTASIVGSGEVTVEGGARCTQTRVGSGRLVC